MITAYNGSKLNIQFVEFENGKCEGEDFYNSLSDENKVGIYKLFMALGNTGFIKSKTSFINEGDKIFAFKHNQVRFLCFFGKNKEVIITHGFIKKQNKIPSGEKDKALKILKLFEKS